MEDTNQSLRNLRNSLLLSTDWTRLNDIALENEDEWLTYRQALRDLPETVENFDAPVWPKVPEVKFLYTGKNSHLQAEKERTQLEEELQTVRTQLGETRTQLERDLQTTQTQIDETRTQLEQALEAEKVKTKNLESRLAFIETAVASLIS